MSRRRTACWLLSVPLMVVGSQVAHELAYWIVYPQAQVRLHELLLSGHGYMNFGIPGFGGYLPMLIGFAGALEFVSFAWVVGARVRGRGHAAVPPWAFALLPALGFSLQEFLERWFAGAAFPWWMVLQPTFRIGLLLQLPFALVAFLLARLLLGVGERVGQALARPRQVPLRLAHDVVRRCSSLCVFPARLPALASGHAERGPPL